MMVIFALLLGVLLGIFVMALMAMARSNDDEQLPTTKEDDNDAT